MYSVLVENNHITSSVTVPLFSIIQCPQLTLYSVVFDDLRRWGRAGGSTLLPVSLENLKVDRMGR